jgi:hypothetical protein
VNDIYEEIKSQRAHAASNGNGLTHNGTHKPEEWCALLRRQIRLADRAACSLATDEITGREEQALINSYREGLIKIAVLALAATESLDAIKSAGKPNK